MSDSLGRPLVTINLARGLCSLLDQGAARYVRAIPGAAIHAYALVDILKQRICESAVLTQEMTALDLARRVGILPAKPKGKRRQVLAKGTKSKPKRRPRA